MGDRKRKHISVEEKVIAVKRHCLEGVAISKICEELGIHVTSYYDWQTQFFENGVKAFESERRVENKEALTKVNELQEKLQRKDHVLSELMEEHIALKKRLGEK